MRVAWFVLLCELNHCACWRIEFSSLILTECYGASDLLTFLVFACLWTNADHLCVIASMRYGRMLYCMCVSYTCWLLRRTKRWIICTAEMWDSESLAADVEKTLAMQDEDIHRECRMTGVYSNEINKMDFYLFSLAATKWASSLATVNGSDCDMLHVTLAHSIWFQLVTNLVWSANVYFVFSIGRE